MRRSLAGGVLAVVAVGAVVWATDPAGEPSDLAVYIRRSYTKYEHRVPMRDGVELFTVVYLPNDTSTRWPMLLIRTPYSVGPYGADRYPDSLGPSEEMAREGYIFVEQDVRGRFMSQGEFVNMRPHLGPGRSPGEVDEATDTYDTIEWLLANIPNHNGKVGIWGNSYPGFYTSAGIIDSHPALVAAMPSAPIADWFFDDMHHHGAFVLSMSFNFFSSFGKPRPEPTTEWPKRFDHGTPDGYRFFLDLGPLANATEHLGDDVAFWKDLAGHPNYDDFWQSRNILPHLKNVKAAVMTVGGLFDAEDLYGPLHTYRSIEEQNPGISNTLVMGPWRHGAWLSRDGRSLADADFGFATAEVFRERAMLPFFRQHLKGEGAAGVPEAWVFETGANRWREFAQWPPRDLQKTLLFLREQGTISPAPPAQVEPPFDEYPSDPAKPVPYTSTITTGWHSEYMVEDQRFAACRPDVLVYRSPVLEEDLTLAGPLTARLWVSTTGEDADWVVKLIDEYPGRLPGFDRSSGEPDLGGTQRMVRSEILRGRFRSNYEHPEPFTPGEVTLVELPLQDVLHTFKRGHRVMVHVQSSLFPFIDRNPQSWVESIFEAEEDDFIRATHRVWRTLDHPSSIEVGVLPPSDLEVSFGAP